MYFIVVNSKKSSAKILQMLPWQKWYGKWFYKLTLLSHSKASKTTILIFYYQSENQACFSCTVSTILDIFLLPFGSKASYPETIIFSFQNLRANPLKDGDAKPPAYSAYAPWQRGCQWCFAKGFDRSGIAFTAESPPSADIGVHT